MKFGFKKVKKNDNCNYIELAYDLFSTLELGERINPDNYETIRKIQNDCTEVGKDYPDREKILLKVIELASKQINSDSLFIIAKAYSWSKVKYNDYAIKYLNMYLESGISEYAVSRYIGINNPESSRKYIHLSQIYNDLGEKYLINYDFQNAMKSFELMLENDNLSRMPYGRQLPYLKIADTYRRMNELDNAIRTLEEARYPDDVFTIGDDGFEYDIERHKKDFNEIINRYLEDYKEKRNKGYIYKPRKSKKEE